MLPSNLPWELAGGSQRFFHLLELVRFWISPGFWGCNLTHPPLELTQPSPNSNPTPDPWEGRHIPRTLDWSKIPVTYILLLQPYAGSQSGQKYENTHGKGNTVLCTLFSFFYPFTPKSDQCQISPAASPEIEHHTQWRTWLFITYSEERWLYYQFSLPHLYVSL